MFQLLPTGELCCGTELLVLADSLPLRALRRRVCGVSPSRCCCEACTRDDNKVSGQRNYTTARGRSTMFCTATICTASHLFTRTERWSARVIEFNMSMFQIDLLFQFSILFDIAIVLLFLFCLKLKSDLFKRIFPTDTKQPNSSRSSIWSYIGLVSFFQTWHESPKR